MNMNLVGSMREEGWIFFVPNLEALNLRFFQSPVQSSCSSSFSFLNPNDPISDYKLQR